MRIEFVEPFDHYPSTLASSTPGAFGTQWPNVMVANPPSLVTGLDGTGKAFKFPQGVQGGLIRRPFVTPHGKLSLHVGFMLDNLGVNSGTTEWLVMYDENRNRQFSLAFTPAGRMRLKGEGNAILATSARLFNPGTAYRMSLAADLTAADASNIKIAFNSSDLDANFNNITIDAQDSTSQLFGEIQFNQVSSSEYDWTIDDVVVGLEENVIWGPLEVAMQGPNADTLAQWSRSAGATNFGNVDEIPFTGDTDYNFSSTVGNKDIFGIVDPTRTPEFIIAVSQLTLARKEDSATRKIRNVLRKAGIDYNGADQDMSESYFHHWTHWVQDPATVAAWNPADFAALESGYENRL